MLIFVYGTLKKGHRNHHLLEGRSKFVGPAFTIEKYAMIDSGFPVIQDRSSDIHPIAGEVYDIGARKDVLADLDQLEAEGRMYHRKNIPLFLTVGKGKRITAYAYIGGDMWSACPNSSKKFLQGNNLVWPARR